MRPFRPVYRPAGHTHAVQTDGCWTFIVTGRKLRRWGFWLPSMLGKTFAESREFFHRFGHAACQD